MELVWEGIFIFAVWSLACRLILKGVSCVTSLCTHFLVVVDRSGMTISGTGPEGSKEWASDLRRNRIFSTWSWSICGSETF